MIKDLATFIVRAFFQMLLWVFIFSIPWNGKPLFHTVHDVVVRSEVILSAQESVKSLWDQLATTAYDNLGYKKAF